MEGPREFNNENSSYSLSEQSERSDAFSAGLGNATNAVDSSIEEQPRIHRPLASGRQEFRVAVLLPSSDFSSTIECRFKHTTLNSKKQYEALSYFWGAPVFTQRILLENKPFYITPNLEIALRHLRYPDRERKIWIDAICIDQANVDERNEQVARMRDIYSHCTVDLFWLGEHNDEVSRGMEIMEKMEGFDITKLHSLGWRGMEEHYDKRYHWYPPRVDWTALRQLFRYAAIWERVWVVQEISCAPKVLLISGNKTMEWDLVERILGSNDYYTDAFHAPFSHSTDTLTSDVFSLPQIIKTQRQIFCRMQTGSESKLLDVLARFRFKKATDPRDNVFGLLGLASDSLGVEVDYHKSVQDVFTRVAECLINASANFDIISQSQWAVFNNSSRHLGLPSWVPDFAAPGNATLLFAQRSVFSAGDPSCTVPCQVSPTGQLNVEGISLGCLKHLQPWLSWQDIHKDESIWHRFWITAGSWLRNHLSSSQIQGAEPYAATGEPAFQAFWRTLVVDCADSPTRRLSPTDVEHEGKIFTAVYNDVSAADELLKLRSARLLQQTMYDWRLTLTDTGLFALVPLRAEVQEGDEFVVLSGAKVPLILRNVGDEGGVGRYEVIGTAYVHGFMDGEAKSLVRDGELEERFIGLV